MAPETRRTALERYLGIDVHRDSSTITVLSAAGKRVRREVVTTSGSALVRSVRELNGRLHVCIEESPWSEWLVEILAPHVERIVVFQNEWRPGAKNDAIDSQGLAEKLRIGQVGQGVFKAPNRYRELREWARVYQSLTRDVARTKNRLKSQFLRRGIRCTGPTVYDPEKRVDWIGELPPAMRPTAELIGLELDRLAERKAVAESALLEQARRHPIAKTLDTVPGLGPIRVALLIATVVTPHRFRSKRQFWSYCGFGVITRTSADWQSTQAGWVKARTVRTRGLNRNHNPTLKAIFKSAAVTAVHQTRADNPMRQTFDRLCAAGTRPHLARITIARKLAAASLAMWKNEEVYAPRS
jgi:transposase